MDPSFRPQVDIREREKTDFKIADSEFDNEDVGARFGDEDWAKMDREIQEEIGNLSSESDEWPDLDEEIDRTLQEDEEREDQLSRKRKERDA